MSHHPIRTAVLTSILAFLPAFLPAHAAVDLAAPIPVGPQVKVGKLPNGLTYYIHPNKRPGNRLELRLVVKAGSVLEEEDQRGLAHFLEHMAFNGSTHFKKHELVDTLQGIGVKMGADLNAYTSYDETVYILPVPTGRKIDVEQAFTILEDWAHGLRLDGADIDKEREIVLEELRLHKGVGERLNKALMPKLFNGSRYAERDPIGTDDSIRNFKPEALRRFYRDWYRPDLMAVVAVGDADPSEIERLVKAHFGGLANPAKERARAYPEIAPLRGDDTVVLTDDEITVNQVSLRYPLVDAPDTGTYGSYREKMVERLMAMMLNQRLAELSQQASPPYVGAGSGRGNLTPRYKGYAASATLGAGGSAPAIEALLREHQRARQYGFTAPELERARKIVERSFERMVNERDTSNSASYAGEYLRNFLAGESLPGVEAEYRMAKEFLPGIGLDEINAFARKTIPADSGKLVVYLGATKSPVPSGAQLLAEVEKASHQQVTAHEEKALAASLMERPATPGKIVEESQDKALGVTRLTFSNGVKAILKPTTLKQDQVLLSAQRYGGQMLFDEKDIPNARFASGLAAVMGLKDFSPLDLQKMMAGRSASAGLAMGSYTEGAVGSSGAGEQDIETMLQMLWLRFAGMRRDEGLFRSYMGKQEAVLRNRSSDPDARFADLVVDTLYQHHPYEPRAIVLDDVAKVSLDRSMEIYRQRFSSAKGMSFVLVGAFDVQKIKPLLASYLGTLPTADIPLDWRDVGLRLATGVQKNELRGGTAPKSTVSLTFSGPATWDIPQMVRVSTLVQVMNLRIIDVLREKMGLIYGGQMAGAVVRLPYEHYSIAVTLPTGPEKVDKLVAALFAEIERMKTAGPAPAELDKVKKNRRLSFERAQQENAFWLSTLQSAEFDHMDPQRMLKVIDDADALTPADIQEAARRYFNLQNYVQVVLNPEQGAAAPAAKVAAATAPK